MRRDRRSHGQRTAAYRSIGPTLREMQLRRLESLAIRSGSMHLCQAVGWPSDQGMIAEFIPLDLFGVIDSTHRGDAIGDAPVRTGGTASASSG